MTVAPLPVDPSPKLHETVYGPVPPVVVEENVTGKLTTELAETVKLVVSGSTLRTVMVFELVAFCWGDEESFAVSATVNALALLKV